MSYERLILEHDVIAGMCARLEQLAQEDYPQPTPASDLLRELEGAVSDHLVNEDASIYNQLISSAAGAKPFAPAEFIDNLTLLREDWRSYLSEWDADCVRLDWPGFCQDTAVMMARVKTRVAAETELLYPLALKLGKIALRDRH